MYVHGEQKMLYRRFILVASVIALMGVGLANLVHYTKQQRDIVLEYPGVSGLQVNRCSGDVHCGLAFTSEISTV